ncbi:MAG: preprotein translocase subunit YajC [Novosphingobium sp.]
MFLTLSAAAGAANAPPAPWWVQSQIPLFVGMFVILWFFILRPQMKRQKDHQAKVTGIKKGDQVLTGGGLVGKVLKVDDTYAELELGQNIKVKALKSTIADVIPPAGAKPAND